MSVDGLVLPYDCGYLFYIALFFLLGLCFYCRVFDCQRVEPTVDLPKQMELSAILPTASVASTLLELVEWEMVG